MSADREALRALMQRYARAADARDLETLRALFAPDAVIDGSRGRSSREQWLAAMAAPAAFASSMHMMGDPLIELDSGGDSARLDTYAVVYQIGRTESGQSDLTLGVRYRDRAVRTGSAWVIAERAAQTVWMR